MTTMAPSTMLVDMMKADYGKHGARVMEMVVVMIVDTSILVMSVATMTLTTTAIASMMVAIVRTSIIK